MERLFKVEVCDRCGGSLEDGRIMSMYNTQIICMKCKAKERQRADYDEAVKADQEAIKAGNYNFPGIGLKPERETYKAMKERHQSEINALPVVFTFSRDQYRETLAAWKITEEEAKAGAILEIGDGGIIRASDKDLVIKTLKRIADEKAAAIAADKDGTGYIYEMFLYELQNHEFSYTQEIDDTLTALEISEEDINSNKALKAGLMAAIDKINAARDPFDE